MDLLVYLAELPPTLIAEFYAGAGQDEAALEWIDRVFERRGEYWLHLYRSPAFDRIRDHPRFRGRMVEFSIDVDFPPAVGEAELFRSFQAPRMV